MTFGRVRKYLPQPAGDLAGGNGGFTPNCICTSCELPRGSTMQEVMKYLVKT